ncbi:MAG: hypothetical protein Q8K55_08885 [Gemmatimonadaceae bacterium]|nr:hypothetical protein [Gemmatimonadaceae bacterium]
MTDSMHPACTPDDAGLAAAFGAIRDAMDAPADTTVGRPSDDVIRREFRLLAAILTLESRRLRSLADDLGSEKTPRDEVIYLALYEGIGMFAAGRSGEKVEQWKALMARLVAANPDVLPPVKPFPEGASR